MGLENYLELIEDLPIEFRDMLVTIRELDLMVQNAMDEKARETEEFFCNAGQMKSRKRESVFQSMMLDFGKIVENADEKINIAERLQDLLMGRLKLFDREIAQFKDRLESQNPGVTSVIEEKVAKSEARFTARSNESKGKKRKKSTKNRKKSSASSSTSSSLDEAPPVVMPAPFLPNMVQNTTFALNFEATILPRTTLNYDSTLYCICNQLSYGEMIACDNPACPYEWFHYPCVNLTIAPEGTWYCSQCRASSVPTTNAVVSVDK